MSHMCDVAENDRDDENGDGDDDDDDSENEEEDEDEDVYEDEHADDDDGDENEEEDEDEDVYEDEDDDDGDDYDNVDVDVWGGTYKQQGPWPFSPPSALQAISWGSAKEIFHRLSICDKAARFIAEDMLLRISLMHPWIFLG